MTAVEIILALSTWQFTAMILGGLTLMIFRKPIAAKISELLHVKSTHGEIGFGKAGEQTREQPKPIEENKTALPPPNTMQPVEPPESAVYAPVEAEAFRRLQEHVGPDKDLQLRWSVRMFATAAVERNHESSYRLIFGSQIAALHALNQRGPIDIAEGIKVFNEAVASDPEFYANSNFTFEQWAGFLIGAGYVETSSVNLVTGTKAGLTPLGRDFIFWLHGRGVPLNKRG